MKDRPIGADSLPPDPDGVAFERTARLAELGVLTASLVHELRQPLMAVKGVLQLARHQGQAADIPTLLGQLQHIEDLLDHYAGFGRVEETLRAYDARSAVGRATAMLAHRCRQRRIALDVVMPDERVSTFGRPTGLQQVMVNLLQNAVDAVEGQVGARIGVTITTSSTRATIDVVDSGPGVDHSVRDRLFEPFVTSKPAGRGTGLGLHIARRMVEEVGGSLDLESPLEPDRGTRARVCLLLVP